MAPPKPGWGRFQLRVQTLSNQCEICLHDRSLLFDNRHCPDEPARSHRVQMVFQSRFEHLWVDTRANAWHRLLSVGEQCRDCRRPVARRTTGARLDISSCVTHVSHICPQAWEAQRLPALADPASYQPKSSCSPAAFRRPLVQIRSSTETKLRLHVDTMTREECNTPIRPLKPSLPGWKLSCTTFYIMFLPASGPHWPLAANGPQLPQLCKAPKAGPVVREAHLCRPMLLHPVKGRSKSVSRPRRALMQ
jgi:hypothetical protein